jgi:hypothetical protein
MVKKKVDLAVQIAASIGNATQVLARAVEKRGGDYTEALVRIGKGEKRYAPVIDGLAVLLAGISRENEPAFAAPEGGRIHVIRGVLVDESLEWNAAIDAGLPNTPASYDIRKVADSYPAKKWAKPKKMDIILINFGTYVSDNAPAHAWGKEQKLPPASPRAIFALGSHAPKLHEELGQPNGLAVGCLEECHFSGRRRVPGGWWDGAERLAYLDRPVSGWYAYCWFAFSRECLDA